MGWRASTPVGFTHPTNVAPVAVVGWLWLFASSDRRAAGGPGPAVAPGGPSASWLIDAVRYGPTPVGTG